MLWLSLPSNESRSLQLLEICVQRQAKHLTIPPYTNTGIGWLLTRAALVPGYTLGVGGESSGVSHARLE